jgi:hypothetical protein
MHLKIRLRQRLRICKDLIFRQSIMLKARARELTTESTPASPRRRHFCAKRFLFLFGAAPTTLLLFPTAPVCSYYYFPFR